MVSTRQMSITVTTIHSDMGGANMPNASRAGSSLSLGQQQSTSRHSNNAIAGGATQNVQTLSLLDMPYEILDRIFSFAGYKEVSNARLVSSQMNQLCINILNSTFAKLQSQMKKRFENIKKVMPRRESARRSHPLSYECDIVETCCMRLSLLHMAFGRYIERKHCCFFPGAILDEVYSVLHYIKVSPELGRPYKITEELIDLSSMAMEYFKDHLEPTMPQIGFFSKGFLEGSSTSSTKNNFMFVSPSSRQSNKSGQSSSMPSPPQSNMVLRKGIRKIKQGMKKYNNQLSVLRTDLRNCKRKSTDQTKHITELQNMLGEQQKQTMEYAKRLDENEKKSEDMSRKISTLFQELNKCKIELHYWRSKSPVTPVCNNCGVTALSVPSTENLLALMDQTINSDDAIRTTTITGNTYLDMESEVQSNYDTCVADLTTISTIKAQLLNDLPASDAPIPATIISLQQQQQQSQQQQQQESLSNVICKAITTAAGTHHHVRDGLTLNYGTSDQTQHSLSIQSTSTGDDSVTPNVSHPLSSATGCNNNSSVILTVGSPKLQSKRKLDVTPAGTIISDEPATTTATGIGSNGFSTNNSNISDNLNKKARRVQSKIKCQTSNLNIKTRNK